MQGRLKTVALTLYVSMGLLLGTVWADVGWGPVPLYFGGVGMGYFGGESSQIRTLAGPLYGNFAGDRYGYGGGIEDWFDDPKNLDLTPVDDGDRATWKHDYCHKLMHTYEIANGSHWTANQRDMAKAVCDYYTLQRLSFWTPNPENAPGIAMKSFFLDLVQNFYPLYQGGFLQFDETTRAQAIQLFNQAYRWVNESRGPWDRTVSFDNPWPKRPPQNQSSSLIRWNVTYTTNSSTLGNRTDTATIYHQEEDPQGQFTTKAIEFAEELHRRNPDYQYRVKSIISSQVNATTYHYMATFQIQVAAWFDISPQEQLLTCTASKENIVIDPPPLPAPPPPAPYTDYYDEGTIPGFEEVDPAGRGLVLGLQGRKTVVCLNRTTAQRVSLVLTRMQTTWDCQAAGLVINPGDTVSITVRGRPQSDLTEITGLAVGFERSSAACTNLATGIRIRKLSQQEVPAINCDAVGLVMHSGDRLVLNFAGRMVPVAAAPTD